MNPTCVTGEIEIATVLSDKQCVYVGLVHYSIAPPAGIGRLDGYVADYIPETI